MKIFHLMGILVALLAAAGCSKEDSFTPIRFYELTEGEQTMAVQEFNNSVTMLASLAKAAPDSNVMMSPLSSEIWLGMVANGAAGQTQAEILHALGAADVKTLNSFFTTVQTELDNAPAGITIHSGNSIWTNPDFTLNSQFRNDMMTNYGAECNELDLQNHQQAESTIQEWMARIYGKDFVEAHLPRLSTNCLFINAISFEGKWAFPFTTHSDTSSVTFTNSDGSVSETDMMYLSDNSTYAYNYIESPSGLYTAINLPYATNSAFSLVIVLPEKTHSPLEVLKTITRENFWEGQTLRYANICLPKFSLNTTVELGNVIESLSLSDAFNIGSADYSNMSTTPWQPTPQTQYCTFSVDENGSTASTSTQPSSGFIAPAPPTPVDFIVDHPFAFLLVHTNTGIVVYSGIVNHL